MIKMKYCIVVLSLVMVGACGSPDQQNTSASNAEMQLLKESDSLSNELSSAGDSVEKKMIELQSALDSLQ